MITETGKFQLIYLTGAPATGKSTMARALADKVSPLKVYHYSELLIGHLEKKRSKPFLTEELRSSSASIITPQDVDTVDRILIQNARVTREYSHVLIDSHAVTKEHYGYRITPFSFDKLRELQPTIICVLYAEADEIIRRIGRDAAGRPITNRFQIDFQTSLQAQVGLAYALELGLPAYFLDTTESITVGLEKLSAMLKR